MNNIVIINGSGGVGKDTFIEQLEKTGIRILNISTVDKIKEIAEQIVPGCSEGKTEAYRRFLSDLKDAFTLFNDLPFNNCKERIESFEFDIAFVHCREPKEIQKFKDRINAKTLLITNPRIPQIITNHADENVFKYEYDYTIENSGSLEELQIKALDFYHLIRR